MFDIDQAIRKNIRELKSYSSARDEFCGDASIWLDANENPYETDMNRYPDPYQTELKKAVAKLKKVEENQIFIGHGSDEIIDLLFRAFCEPQVDKAYLFPPTYGMYAIGAQINQVEIVELPLLQDFDLPEWSQIQSIIRSKGLLFMCSPNNPTGTAYSLNSIQELASQFPGIVAVDEAYIDFSETPSAISLLSKIPNLVVLQTLSKAYGLAGLRVGMAFTHPEIIKVLNKIKPPYNINTLSQQMGLKALENREIVLQQIQEIKHQREWLRNELEILPQVVKVHPSEANFLLVQFEDTSTNFKALLDHGIVVRNRARQVEGCLRITIGTPDQNKTLLQTLKSL
ncbi:histidinol-phosphate transaminase [bacterium SCSIO 12741]|nr:histidinol-phosphate transaminase [bacterium SCSIO 12741]